MRGGLKLSIGAATVPVLLADFTQLPMARMVGKLTVILDAEFVK